MDKYDVNKRIAACKVSLTTIEAIFKPTKLLAEIEALDTQMSAADFWNDQINAKQVSAQAALKKDQVQTWESLSSAHQELVDFLALDDESMDDDIEAMLKTLERHLDAVQLQVMLHGKYDHLNCLIEIHPGAGGTESQDWASMLFEMYIRYAQTHQYGYEVLEYNDGEEAGLKSATLLIKGRYAYGYLRGEMGVHRLVRISPFDSGARRHTSFASVEVIPELDDTIEIVIKEEELRVDTYRASGAGGQHINTTDSAVRITHLPTNVVVSVQSERSQIANRKRAMDVLKAKLIQLQELENKKHITELAGEKREINFGSQIRSYVLHPYMMVKDHRTNVETGQPDKVFAGDLDMFVQAFLKEQA